MPYSVTLVSAVQWSESAVCTHIVIAVQSLSHAGFPATHGLQHVSFPCPSLSLRVCSNSCPLSWWCHPAISSCHPLLCLPSIIPRIRVFSNELAIGIRWPVYWSFSISYSNEYSGLISFRIDWFDPLAIQRTLKGLFQKPQFAIKTYIHPLLDFLPFKVTTEHWVELSMLFENILSKSSHMVDAQQALLLCTHCSIDIHSVPFVFQALVRTLARNRAGRLSWSFQWRNRK